MTLAQLRALLALAHGPAVERVQRLPENAEMVQWPAFVIAAPYLPKKVRVIAQPSGRDVAASLHAASMWDKIAGWSLDLTDPGTVNAVKVALALALGSDPGPMGLAVSWFPLPACNSTPWSRWCVMADRLIDFTSTPCATAGSIHAPAVAAESDAVKALVLAVECVLGASEGR